MTNVTTAPPGLTLPQAATPGVRTGTLTDANRGLLLGLLGVACFCLTPVATRAAVSGGLSPLLVAAGRALGATLLAWPLLRVARQPWPSRGQLFPLLAVTLGSVIGFPLLMTWALARVPAAHAAAVLGLLPLATSIAGAFRGRERLPFGFWAAGVAGSGIVVAYTLAQGGGHLEPADLALLGAVLAAAVGYAEGALVSRTLGGWQTISWALVLGAPVTGLLTAVALWPQGGGGGTALAGASPSAWMGLAYVTVVSQFLGFFPWYRGLALGGVARVSQVQLLMPFLTIVASALLLGERVSVATVLTAGAVLATVAAGRWAARRDRAEEVSALSIRLVDRITAG